MTKTLNSPTQFGWLLVACVLISCLAASQAKSSESNSRAEMVNDQDDDQSAQEERRTYDLKKLRHFLLTSNAAQRASKREQQELLKRELVREYLRSIDDPSPSRFEEIKKRFKTYCNSYEDLMNSNWAACG